MALIARSIKAAALAAALATAAPATAEAPAEGSAEGLSPRELMTLAVDTMNSGNPALAAVMADALIARDPEDVPARILRAETAIALGDFRGGYVTAREAWRVTDVEVARFASARLAALSLAQEESYTASQFWLRRARHHAPDAATRDSVARDYAYVRRRNPLAFQLDLSIAPSDNINNGTTNEYIALPGLKGYEFTLVGDSQALSGVEYTLGAAARYRLREGPRSMTVAEVTAYHRGFRLSEEARAISPDSEGADFAELQLTFGIEQRWLSEGAELPWRLSLRGGRFWYAGEPWSDFVRAGLGRGLRLGPDDRLDLDLDLERLENHASADSTSAALEGRWTHAYDGLGALSVSLGARNLASTGEDRAYEARSAGLAWTFEESGISLAFDYELRDYDETAYLLEPRQDIRRSLRVDLPVPGVEVYGFRPVVTAEHRRTGSNVTRFETESTGAALSFRSAF